MGECGSALEAGRDLQGVAARVSNPKCGRAGGTSSVPPAAVRRGTPPAQPTLLLCSWGGMRAGSGLPGAALASAGKETSAATRPLHGRRSRRGAGGGEEQEEERSRRGGGLKV